MAAIINNNITNTGVDNKSFALLRTNPKLTSNAKLVVDGEGELFLSSFRASKELSRVEYQQYHIRPEGRYSDDLADFYRGLTAVDKYQVLRNYSDVTVFSDYGYQYEDQYQYGAIHNSSKLYKEQYKIFAPIWLDKKIPSKFVIYRVKDVDYDSKYTEDNVGQTARISELLKNATIVKTFDIAKTAKLGEYLSNHVNDKQFPDAATTINFEEGEQSTFNGIDLLNGGFTSKAEQLDRYYTQVDYPEFFNNKTITQGFERNQLAIANIINLEFLFDDVSADDYDIYRYFGIYADAHDEGYFKSDGMNANGEINVNINSYRTAYDLNGTVPPLVEVDMFPRENDFNIPQLKWVKDKYNEFYNLTGSITTTSNHRLLIENNKAKRDIFEGYAKSGNKVVFLSKKPNYRGFIKFTVTGVPSTNDLLFIGDKTEMEISGYAIGDYILIADNSIPAGRAIENRFSNLGSLQQIAIAIAGAIENGEIVTYATHVNGTSVIVEDFMSGYQRRQTAFAVYSLNFASFITIDIAEDNNIGLIDSIVPPSASTVFSDWNIYTMIGGSDEGQSVLVESKEIGNITVDELVKQKDSEVFITINEIIKDPFLEETWRVVLNNPVKISNDNLFESYVPYITSHGVFSAYDFKDFDFDRYSTRNSSLGDLILDEKYAVTIIPNSNTTVTYVGWALGHFILTFYDTTLPTPSTDYLSRLAIGDLLSFDSGKTTAPIVSTYPLGSLAAGITTITIDASASPLQGTFDPSNITFFTSSATGDPYRNIDTFYAGLTGILEPETIIEKTTQEIISNEYDRLNENELKESAIESRIVPTICKFELVNASNARNLPYILNTNEAFGEDNLSPNIEIDAKRKVEFLNMEHFHINKIPSTLYGNRNDLNNYVDLAGDGGLTVSKLTDTSFNYFDRHFNWNGYYDDSTSTWYDNSYKRLWSKFDRGNNAKDSSAVFRGLRYTYLERKETTKQVPTEFVADSNIDDYKFGVVFTYNNGFTETGDPILDNSVKFNSVKNDVFKFICIFIELNVVRNAVLDIDRYLLYTLENIEDEFTGLILDTNIPFLINFTASDFPTSVLDKDRETELKADQASVLDGSARFPDYVTPNIGGEFSWIYFAVIGKTWAVKVRSIPGETSVLVQGWPWEFDPSTGNVVGNNRLDPINFALIPINSTFTYHDGGENGFGVLLNEINAYNMSKRFNRYGNINYMTVDVNGNIILNDYVISIESGVNIIKPSLILPQEDPDRPKAYLLSNNEIGSVISPRKDGGYAVALRRMNGNYNPLFNPVVTFSEVYSNNKVIPAGTMLTRDGVIYNRFNEMGLAFDAYKLNNVKYGYIENYFFHKTNVENSNNVLRLSETTDKLPLYPKIAEIAIDKKNINMFKSKYSSDYFTKSLPGFESELVYGTLSPIEKKNFMASTIMKVKDIYDITRYTNRSENSIEELDRIRINNDNTESIHWYEDSQQVTADVYVQSAILSELLEDGIYNQFKKYVEAANSFGDKTTVLDDLDVYVKQNISPRFIIDIISIYGIEEKSIQTDFISTTDVDELTNNGFKELTNYNIQSYQNNGLSFRLIYNKRNGYSYKFKIHVKIEA